MRINIIVPTLKKQIIFIFLSKFRVTTWVSTYLSVACFHDDPAVKKQTLNLLINVDLG